MGDLDGRNIDGDLDVVLPADRFPAGSPLPGRPCRHHMQRFSPRLRVRPAGCIAIDGDDVGITIPQRVE